MHYIYFDYFGNIYQINAENNVQINNMNIKKYVFVIVTNNNSYTYSSYKSFFFFLIGGLASKVNERNCLYSEATDSGC